MGNFMSTKEQSGLGIINLEVQNICLLSKWLFKLINEDGVWQEILRKKYLKNKTIGEVRWKPGDSHFWSGLMKSKDHFLESSTFNIYNGEQIRFWEDKWLRNITLKEEYSSLYNIARKKHISIAHVFRSAPLNIMFRRALVGDKLQRWNELVAKIAFVQLDDQRDSIKWNLTKQGTFTGNQCTKIW
jgi:hypothetical protein